MNEIPGKGSFNDACCTRGRPNTGATSIPARDGAARDRYRCGECLDAFGGTRAVAAEHGLGGRSSTGRVAIIAERPDVVRPAVISDFWVRYRARSAESTVD
ncbi:hypothetical protein [Prauserella marina]|uniref:hypothetical protein n=1 Tax=Prauserella marina TaxID=530584 RepID=UPI0011B431D5|nr:hypothetical protein [Prauserella marina]